jgi:integrase
MRKRTPESHPNGYFYGRIKGRRINLGKNYRKAEAKLRGLEKDLTSKVLEVGGDGTTLVSINGKKDVHIKELAHYHLKWVKENRAEETFIYRQRIVGYFLKFVGDKMVSEITNEEMDRFYSHARKHHGRGLNGGNQLLRGVKTMFRWGAEHEVCDCPIKRFPVAIKKPPATKKFTADEIVKLLAVSQPDFADLIRFAILTGLRPVELRTLKKTDIESNGDVTYLNIEHHKTSASSRVPMPRSVPLTNDAVEIVNRQIKRKAKSPYLFLNGGGTPYTKDSLRIRLERNCRRAKIPLRPPYAWRHFFGTMQGANGTNMAVLAQIMGHSNLQTTARYVANNDEAHIKAVSIMQKFI